MFFIISNFYCFKVDRLRKLKMEDGETNNIRPIQNSANRPVYYLQCQKKKQQ